ncbi:MAG TPA: DUF503 domain-containing protein [Anaerolineae bacterium]|mgnify:CR=1 FL=1|nr:DUF503 domain-containing protein [Anaerolineae bacterium]HQH38290.1 DUF503 domain-containing protein [Anaerolineae bacterium]
MIIGACTLHLYLPGVLSLKEKRGLLKPLLHQLRRRFDVAAAEVGHNDTWQTADIAIVAVASDAGHIYTVLEKAVHWIEAEYRAAEVLDWNVELR